MERESVSDRNPSYEETTTRKLVLKGRLSPHKEILVTVCEVPVVTGIHVSATNEERSLSVLPALRHDEWEQLKALVDEAYADFDKRQRRGSVPTAEALANEERARAAGRARPRSA